MFTGIVEKLGKVSQLTPLQGGTRITLQTPFEDLQLGESICTSGVCLTVEAFDRNGETQFFLSNETLERTKLNQLKSGDFLNLERALTPTTRLSGHYVQGHVDGVGTVEEIEPLESGAYQVKIKLPTNLMRYCVKKGSITIDGVSLTINDFYGQTGIELMIIPHTWKMTGFQYYAPGSSINVEVDILAKYVERLVEK